MIAEALQEAAQQHNINGLLTGNVVGQSQIEGLVVQLIQLVIGQNDGLGGLGITVGKHSHQLVSSVIEELNHLGKHRLSGFGNRRSRIDAAGCLGHVAGKIAHALKGGSQSHGGNDHAQIGGHRILLSEQLYALVENRRLQSVNLDVTVNHGLGRLNVLIQQRFPGALNRLAHVLRHAVEVIGNLLQLLVKNNAHFFSLSCFSFCNLYQCIIPAFLSYFNVGNGNLKLFYCSLGCLPEIHVTGVPINHECRRVVWNNKGMTLMPLPVVVALIIAAVLLLVLVAVLVVGFVTHRISWDSPLLDDDEDDDLSDDTAALLSMLPTTSIVIDDNDDVVRCSPVAYRLGVVSDDAIVEREVLDAVHEVRQSGGKRQFDLTTATPERYSGTREKDDHVDTQSVHRPNWLKITVGRINEHFIVVLISDVSDSIRFSQVRDSFITNVSEQLLGPTEALAKLADSLEAGDLDERQVADDAQQVRSSCNKLNHMVSDLLLLIRAQEPITPSSANRLNVMEQLRQVTERLEPLAAQSGVRLNVVGDEGLVVNGEADQIDSAVTKLVENAIGYSSANGTVSVSAAKAKDGNQAVIRVIDQGVGIAKKDQARIFERFYRGSSQSERTVDGVGLGLAIVKHVALTHHGDVSVWSAPGQGSTFSLTLPLAQ